jgi:hypothetical protein
MKRARGCLEPLRAWAIGMVVGIPAFLAVVYFHEHAARWEPAAIFSSLVPGVALTLLYFRRGRLGWLIGMAGGMFLMFSFTLALFHGWAVQAEVVFGAGGILLFVGMLILMSRARWSFHKAMGAINADMQDHALVHSNALFRDDGERMVVYPNRRWLLPQCAFQALLLAGLGGVLAFAPIHNPIVWWALWIFACVLMTVFLAVLYRLLIRKPTLIVGPDGILDNGSLLATGRGLLRWDEILTAIPHATTSSGFVTNRYLLIVVPDGRAIRKRQPLWKQLLILLLVQASPFRLTIWQGLLDVPADELATRIARYVQTHAPPGWVEMDDDEDAERPVQP